MKFRLTPSLRSNAAIMSNNLNYWQFGDYLGIGAGAHGKITESLPNQITRSSKAKSPDLYLQNPSQSGDAQTIPIHELPLEFIMNQLRLRRGFTLSHYQATTGLDKASLEPALSVCMEQNLITNQNDHFICTEKGWNFLDRILEKFMA